MSDFETRECANCGDSFVVHPSARAAKNRYCSPGCETVGEGLV